MVGEQYALKSSRTKYPSPGRCIYCGKSEGVHLTDEHIIPFSLDGTWILEDSSCDSCCKVTQKFELIIARKQFYNARLLYNSKSRKSKKNRPTHMDVEFRISDELKSYNFPVSKHPVPWMMLDLDPPGLLVDRKIDPATNRWVTIHRQPKFIAPYTATKIKHWTHTCHKEYMQLLAKIGHSQAVATYGLNAFEPFLREIIFGNLENAQKYIGCTDKIPPRHEINHHALHCGLLPFHDQILIILYLRLFSGAGNPGTPVYIIIAGRLHDDYRFLY